MLNFNQVSTVNLRAFNNNNKTSDIVTRKQEIVDTLCTFYNLNPTSVLFVGFSSFVMAQYSGDVYVTAIDREVQDFLAQQGIKYTYIPELELINYRKQFQAVIAVDEFFTFSDTDTDQRNLVNQICNLTSEFVITTLKDYKNQEYKDREFSMPTVIKNSKSSTVFLESHEWSQADRNAWISNIYQIDTATNTLNTYGQFNRRTMYFKQLAKFSADVGATHFLVHKNLMYKGLYKKNYEHVITIRFD